MRREIRWALIAVGGIALLSGGASIFVQPEHEVLYSAQAPVVWCAASRCYATYALEVGNTGEKPQTTIRVGLRRAAVEETLLKPTIRTFGKVDRRTEIHETDEVRTYILSEVRSGERITIQFILPMKPVAEAPRWDQ